MRSDDHCLFNVPIMIYYSYLIFLSYGGVNEVYTTLLLLKLTCALCIII